ncbi:hypothetical protein [Halomarina rubra]|uniref:Right handed beta helix domain-containing protein n=1 Tax=Halomarina rubra TaxID=2071873 RepID=A0ABD6B283_9EURY|nr:hypothetical protein [Halomarina rubra]
MLRHDIEFDEVAHAIEDLGWDPDGETPIDLPTRDGLLIEVPPGEYAFPMDEQGGDQACTFDRLERWGLRGLGDSPDEVRFRTASGESGWFIRADGDSRDYLLENLAFDNTDDRAGGDIGNWLRARDGLEVHDVDHLGFSGAEPFCRWSILPAITSSSGSGRIVRYRKTGPSVFAGHGASDGGGGVFDHDGHLTFRDCVIANQGGDGGLYTGKHPGSIVFENCAFRNNDMAAIRLGAGCELRDCEIVIDWDDAHPENVLAQDISGDVLDAYHRARGVDEDTPAESPTRITNHPPTGTSGVYFTSAQYGKSGGGIYGCDIRIESTYDRGMAAILINPSDAIRDLHDTTVHCDVDQRAVWFMDPREQRFDSHRQPALPWSVDIRNLTVTGQSDCRGEAAVILEGRHDSTISGLAVDMPNAARELDADSSTGVVRTDGGETDETTTPMNLRVTNDGDRRAFYSFRASGTRPREGVPDGQTNHHRDGNGAGGYLAPGETHTWLVSDRPGNCSTVGASVTLDGEALGDVPAMATPDYEAFADAWGYPPAEETDDGGDSGNGSDGSGDSGDGSDDSDGEDGVSPARVDALESVVETISTDLATAETRLNDHGQRISDVEVEQDSQDERLGDLDERVSANRSVFQRLRDALSR